MNYELRLEAYQGPLDKLLELIEEKKLEISRLSLAAVTADFLKYLKGLEEKQMEASLLADFLVIASRLILIKSKELLPSLVLTEEEEADIKNLEWGLKIYRELKKTHPFLRKRWQELPQLASREFMAGSSFFFFPPKDLRPADLAEAMARLCQTLESFFKPTASIRSKIVNLKAKIEEVLSKLTEKPVGFRQLHGQKNRSELVVLFLAILHLIKDQLIQAEQAAHFDEIRIAKAARNG